MKLLGYHLILSICSGTLRTLIALNGNIKSKFYLPKISREVQIEYNIKLHSHICRNGAALINLQLISSINFPPLTIV